MEGRFPLPPLDTVLDPTVQTWMLIIFGAAAFLALLYAIKTSWREKDPVHIYFWIGGALCTLYEPLDDLLGMCWYPEIGQIVGYYCFGRPIPLYIVFVFAFYFGPPLTFLIGRFEKGITSAWLVKCFIIGAVLAFVFEPIFIHFGAWLYYGKQPFVLFGFPLWWGPVNSGCVILTAVCIYKVLPYLPGWRKTAVIPLIPIACMITHDAMAFPINSALNTLHGKFVTSLGAIAATLLGFFFVWLGSKLVFEKPVEVVK